MICFQGWFSLTELYYGYYTNKTININSDKSYKMQVAYLFTCGGYYLLTLVILGHRWVFKFKIFSCILYVYLYIHIYMLVFKTTTALGMIRFRCVANRPVLKSTRACKSVWFWLWLAYIPTYCLYAYQHLGQQQSSSMSSCLWPVAPWCSSCGQDPSAPPPLFRAMLFLATPFSPSLRVSSGMHVVNILWSNFLNYFGWTLCLCVFSASCGPTGNTTLRRAGTRACTLSSRCWEAGTLVWPPWRRSNSNTRVPTMNSRWGSFGCSVCKLTWPPWRLSNWNAIVPVVSSRWGSFACNVCKLTSVESVRLKHKSSCSEFKVRQLWL